VSTKELEWNKVELNTVRLSKYRGHSGVSNTFHPDTEQVPTPAATATTHTATCCFPYWRLTRHKMQDYQADLTGGECLDAAGGPDAAGNHDEIPGYPWHFGGNCGGNFRDIRGFPICGPQLRICCSIAVLFRHPPTPRFCR